MTSWSIGAPNDAYPTSISMGFGVGGESGMGSVPNGLSQPMPTGGMLTADDHGRSFGTGTSGSNMMSINSNWVQQFTARFPKSAIQKEMICFANRSRLSELLKLPVDHELAGLNEMNRWLIGPDGRQAYGRHTSCKQLMEDFGFAGVYNASVPDWVGEDATWDAATVIARRARTNACFTRAYTPKGNMVTDRILTWVFMLIIRKQLTDSTRTRNADGDVVDPEEEEKRQSSYYWNIYPYVSETQSAPAPWLYIDDQSTGTAIRVGFISEFSPSNNVDTKITTRAREAISGKANAVERKYQKAISYLPTVDLALM